ncbi:MULTISPECIES: hypothetical protein [unclassified Mucilaginibacter]|uniref:hypothetical protein n=1 Tax=unclassified Mucilaginibacter TaxID=2617802 RepID=UPI002AC9E1B6|nr:MULTISPECIES: hypothetical protein [unclassified Mucilaginibacter]MEB0263200.1 hypothetical protein [Mucilaginibacter sp. 10I4]MEB0280088.1 hypothetical protein [Mucilaginibacter sp. 10B2]MEB0301076.1 hypothetical protein [Mucilaginibacter sp. 5C4]WPX24504.1 hypothetical protein RHM67_04340 [Mucilaginibacter sp. 5C4]
MKKLVLKGLLAQAEELTREEQKNVVGGYDPVPPTYHWVYCKNAGGYTIGSFQSSTCNYASNLGACQSMYPGSQSAFVQGC